MLLGDLLENVVLYLKTPEMRRKKGSLFLYKDKNFFNLKKKKCCDTIKKNFKIYLM